MQLYIIRYTLVENKNYYDTYSIIYDAMYRELLTNVIISLARSLARSGVMKQDNPLRATPVSYITWLLKSYKIKQII